MVRYLYDGEGFRAGVREEQWENEEPQRMLLNGKTVRTWKNKWKQEVSTGFVRSIKEEHKRGVEMTSEMAFQFSLACLYCQDMEAR